MKTDKYYSSRKSSAWTREKISHLIELYRKRECLWDIRHEFYKNKEQRNRAIEEICGALAISKFEFGKKIHNLRNQFNSEMKKLHQRLETAGGTFNSAKSELCCKWTHFESLMFLRDVIEPRPGNTYHVPSYHLRKKLCLKSECALDDDELDDDEEDEEKEEELEQEQQIPNATINIKKARKLHNNRQMVQRRSSVNHFSQYDSAEDNNHDEDNVSLSNSDYQNLEQINDTYPTDDKNEVLPTNIVTSATSVPLTASSLPITTNGGVFTSNISQDQWSIFGDLIANELRHLNSDVSRKKLKRKIMQAMLEVGEDDDKYSKHFK